MAVFSQRQKDFIFDTMKTAAHSKMSTFAAFESEIKDVRDVAKDLGSKMEKLKGSRDALQSYLSENNTTGRELNTFQEYHHKVTKLSKDASQIAEKASSKLQIAFVGTVSAGKSLLINTLLHDDILPVNKAETTFCSVAISGTTKSKWSARVRDSSEILEPRQNLKQLLNFLKGKDEKKTFKIEPSSVIDVEWPTKNCRAVVESVVLYDTPGIGQRDETDDAVIRLCKKVDAIVAVMNIHSPSLKIVS